MSKHSSAAPVLIIGTGLAGYNLAREFRKHEANAPLCLVTSDDGRSYSKPMLSAAFQKGKDADSLALAGPDRMAEQLNATIRTHTRITGIDSQSRTAWIGDEPFAYRQLVFASGAQVIRIGLEGDAVDEVLSVNDLMDYARLRKSLVDARRVLIMGAGLIGCELASDLVHAGFEVEIVAPDQQLLQRLVPAQAASALQSELQREGVKICLGPAVTGVDHAANGDGYIVHLSDSSVREADLVISAVGLRARTELAQSAGLDTGRGIQVDQTLAASAAGVYALGDCAEVCGHMLHYILPLMASARALAQTLSGTPTAVHYPAMPVTVKTPACPTVCLTPDAGLEGEWEISADGPNVRGLFRDESGVLRGFVLTGSAVAEKMALAKLVPDLLSR